MDRVIQVGNIVDDSQIGFKNPQRGRIYSADGISPCLNTCGGGNLEPKILTDRTICMNSKVNGKQPSLEHRVYDIEGIATAVTTGFHPSIAEPKIIVVGKVNDGKHQQDFVQHEEGISRALCCGTHGSGPHLTKTLVSEPICVAMRGRNPDNPSERGKSDGKYKQRIEPNMSGVANTITSVQKDSMVALNYRIRKLTPRECFRLMGVDDVDIDKIQAAGISNSRQYQLAGNSIVVHNLAEILRTLLIDKEQKVIKQLTLF